MFTTSNNNTLLCKVFNRSSKTDNADNASTVSGGTLIRKQPVKFTSQEEHDSVSDLMAKVNTMTEKEFKAYLKEHEEEVEAGYRKQGCGIAGGSGQIGIIPPG